MEAGLIEAIVIGARRAGTLAHVDRVRVYAGHGVEGDRHFRRNPSPDDERGQDLTLIEAEALEREHCGLVHRRGLRADVVRGGSIAVGDEVAPL